MGEVNTFIQSIPLNYFIILSSVLFCLGVLGVLLRKNAIVILGCVEPVSYTHLTLPTILRV